MPFYSAELAWLGYPWAYALGALTFVASVLSTLHAVLYKRDVRAATAWVGVIWLAPLIGAVAYLVLGVNRIHRRAIAIFGDRADLAGAVELVPPAPESGTSGLAGVRRLVDGLGRRPVVGGNRLRPLVGGDEAYGAMLEAIENAETSIALQTYIFDSDPTGMEFIGALERAHHRGVEVRVLIDAIGDRYSRPPACQLLRRRGIRAVHFLPTLVPWRAPYFNLRNHRKILVVDGRVGFTGGMNIRQGHREDADEKQRVVDVHFEIVGPGVRQLQEVFAEDWLFSAREELSGEPWFPLLDPVGDMAVRAVADGPDRDLEQIRWALLGGIACAERRLAIQTPYFLPIRHLSMALQIAARRGVEVDLLLPETTNLLLVHWASRSMWREVLESGCRLWLVPKPFDHSKLMIMDDRWCFVGSSNWDPRSLRLNFELNVECWSSELNSQIAEILGRKKRQAHRLTLEEHESRGYPVRLLDGVTRLFSPYL